MLQYRIAVRRSVRRVARNALFFRINPPIDRGEAILFGRGLDTTLKGGYSCLITTYN